MIEPRTAPLPYVIVNGAQTKLTEAPLKSNPMVQYGEEGIMPDPIRPTQTTQTPSIPSIPSPPTPSDQGHLSVESPTPKPTQENIQNHIN